MQTIYLPYYHRHFTLAEIDLSFVQYLEGCSSYPTKPKYSSIDELKNNEMALWHVMDNANYMAFEDDKANEGFGVILSIKSLISFHHEWWKSLGPKAPDQARFDAFTAEAKSLCYFDSTDQFKSCTHSFISLVQDKFILPTKQQERGLIDLAKQIQQVPGFDRTDLPASRVLYEVLKDQGIKRAGDKGDGHCLHCGPVKTTYQFRTYPFLEGRKAISGVLSSVCDGCGNVISFEE